MPLASYSEMQKEISDKCPYCLKIQCQISDIFRLIKGPFGKTGQSTNTRLTKLQKHHVFETILQSNV